MTNKVTTVDGVRFEFLKPDKPHKGKLIAELRAGDEAAIGDELAKTMTGLLEIEFKHVNERSDSWQAAIGSTAVTYTKWAWQVNVLICDRTIGSDKNDGNLPHDWQPRTNALSDKEAVC